MQNNENSGVDPNDAPEGFIAVVNEDQDLPSCSGCYYQDSVSLCSKANKITRCTPMYREDGKYVIFIKKQDNKGTLSYPCGSLGEEIE